MNRKKNFEMRSRIHLSASTSPLLTRIFLVLKSAKVLFLHFEFLILKTDIHKIFLKSLPLCMKLVLKQRLNGVIIMAKMTSVNLNQ